MPGPRAERVRHDAMSPPRDALWLHLNFPNFVLEVMTRGMRVATQAPVVIIESEGGEGAHAKIIACGALAVAVGLKPGMTLGSAWALAAGLTVCTRDVAAEMNALRDVAAWAMQFSSMVVVCPPCGVSIEIGGSLGFFGGLEILLEQIQSGAEELGFSVGMAAAPTPIGACLMAHSGIVMPVRNKHQLEGVLSDLPVGHLGYARLGSAGLPQSSITALDKLGLHTLGECEKLPRAALGRRVEGLVPLLDKAYGRVPDPRTSFELPSHFHAQLSLPAPVMEVEALVFGLNRLVQALSGYLEARAAGAMALVLTLSYETNHERSEISLRMVTPSRDPSHLMVLAREKLERFTLPANVSGLTLSVPETGVLAPESMDFFAARSTGQDAVQGLAQLVERLGARLGEQAVQGLDLRSDHRPERAWASTSPVSPATKRPEASSASRIPGALARPSWLLPSPVPLTTAQGCPLLGGVLVLEAGPERIESGWWDGADVSRDYYSARNPLGEKVWIYEDRREPGTWYLHGIFA